MVGPRWRRNGREDKTIDDIISYSPVVVLHPAPMALGKLKQRVPFERQADILRRLHILEGTIVVILNDLPDEEDSAETVGCGVMKGENQRGLSLVLPPQENPEGKFLPQIQGIIDPLKEPSLIVRILQTSQIQDREDAVAA